MHLYSVNPQKQRHSEMIARQTEEFLARGGEIEVVDNVHYYPNIGMRWIARAGMDYSTWRRHGSRTYLKEAMAVSLGNGNIMTQAAPFEGGSTR